jgi:hypothetical protein
VVEQSVEEYSLDEPTGAQHSNELAAGALADEADAASRPDSQALQPEDIQGICANPLAEEPGPIVIGAVKRFGVVGLVACALGAAVARWWKSRVH